MLRASFRAMFSVRFMASIRAMGNVSARVMVLASLRI